MGSMFLLSVGIQGRGVDAKALRLDGNPSEALKNEAAFRSQSRQVFTFCKFAFTGTMVHILQN